MLTENKEPNDIYIHVKCHVIVSLTLRYSKWSLCSLRQKKSEIQLEAYGYLTIYPPNLQKRSYRRKDIEGPDLGHSRSRPVQSYH